MELPTPFIFAFVILAFMLALALYWMHTASHYQKLPVCAKCLHKLEKIEIEIINIKTKEKELKQITSCPICKNLDNGWSYGYVVKGGSFAEDNG